MNKKKRYFARVKKLYFHPKSFLESIEKEKSYSDILFFYIKIALFSIIIAFVFSSIVLISKGNSVLLGFLNLILSSVFNFAVAFAVPFVISGIIHLGVLIFKGKNKFFNTYKPVAYSLVIGAVYGIISTIILGVIGIVNPVNITDSADPLQLLTNRSLIISIAIYLIIFLISLIHTLYFETIGVAKFQKISKLRAFFSIILIPLILMVIIIAIAVYIISTNPSLLSS